MIWATVSSWSCFCWLYRASPSLAAKTISVWLGCWPSGDVRVYSLLFFVGRGCLLWPVCSPGRTLLTFALLHSVLQGQICLLLQAFLDFLLLHSIPPKKGHLFWVLVIERRVDLHWTIQFQFLQHYWLGYRLELLWYWMVCLGNKQRSFFCFWDCIQVLHFRLFCWPWWLLHFFWRITAHTSRYNGHLS